MLNSTELISGRTKIGTHPFFDSKLCSLNHWTILAQRIPLTGVTYMQLLPDS